MVEVRRIVYHDMMRRFRLEYDIGYGEECDVAGASVAKARVSIVCSGEISQVKFFWFSRCIFCTVLKGACLRGHGVPGRPRIATS